MARSSSRPVFVALCLIGLAPSAAFAHAQSLSYGDYQVRGAEVDARLRFAALDLADRVHLVRDGSGNFTSADVEKVAPAIFSATLAQVSASSEKNGCILQPIHAVSADGKGGLVITGSFQCPGDVGALELNLGFISELPSGHTHLSLISFDGGAPIERLAQDGSEVMVAQRQADLKSTLGKLFLLGVGHIFTGYDHVAFLIGLLLLGGTLRRLIGIVSAFTVAHSITLALAALNIFAPPPQIIEPSIALSIIFIAGEDLWALRNAGGAGAQGGRSELALRHRWMITFAFGLIHGFGFAGALRELHLPRAGLAASLVMFNLGVEAGQICIVALVFPLLKQLRMSARPGRAVSFALAAIIGLLGAFWLVQRIFLIVTGRSDLL